MQGHHQLSSFPSQTNPNMYASDARSHHPSQSQHHVPAAHHLYNSSGAPTPHHDGNANSASGSSTVPLHLTIDQLKGQVVKLCKTHNGSRFLQSKLDMKDPVYFGVCYNEMMNDSLGDLAIDHYGHFTVEKLILCCNTEQLYILVQNLSKSLNTIAIQKHGSFCIQTLIDCITPEQLNIQQLIVDYLKDTLYTLMTHPAGHFVVLKLLQRFSSNVTKRD